MEIPTFYIFFLSFFLSKESSNSKPIILKSLLTNNTAVLGSEASFHCHVTSDSVTYVRWYFKRHAAERNASDNTTSPATVTEISSIVPVKIVTLLRQNGLSDRFKVNAVFLVKNVSLHDEGEYICEAFNQHGRVSWSAFLVVVQGTLFCCCCCFFKFSCHVTQIFHSFVTFHFHLT